MSLPLEKQNISSAATYTQISKTQAVFVGGAGKLVTKPDYVRNIFEKTRPGKAVVRQHDLVALRIETQNMEIVPGKGLRKIPRLRKKGSGQSFIILHFPPQSFAEEAFFESEKGNFKNPQGKSSDAQKNALDPLGGDSVLPPPVRARIANESRLVFIVPNGFEIDYTLSSLLEACRNLPLKVSTNAIGRQLNSISSRINRNLVISSKVSANKALVSLTPVIISSDTLPIKRRIALSSDVVNTLRINVMADNETTVRMRQYLVGATYLAEKKIVELKKKPELSVVPKLSGLLAQPSPPDPLTTSIEMPWRLILSPHSGARWRHATRPAFSDKTLRTELWHSRLVTPRDDKEIPSPYCDEQRTLRAIWALSGFGAEAATDKDGKSVPMEGKWPSGKLPAPKNNPFRTTLDDFDRYQIVHLSSNSSVSGYLPEPIDTNTMTLSALGGWLDSRGAWDGPGLSLEEWVHRATMGRDHFVRVVYRGFLFPFGHRVALIKVSERKFYPTRSDGNVAYLFQRLYIVVREKERTFDGDLFLNAVKNDGTSIARKFPFSRIKILTDTTPNLDNPAIFPSSVQNYGQLMFWPHVNQGKPFKFQCAATDLDGRRVLFDMPMIFMDGTLTSPRYQKRNSSELLLNYLGSENPGNGLGAEDFAEVAMQDFNGKGPQYNTAELNWQYVALASSLKSGDTSVQVERLKFSGFTQKGNQSLRLCSENLTIPIWAPQVDQIKARIGPIAHLSGAKAAHTLVYNQTYLRVGFLPTKTTGNRGEVFVDVVPNPGDPTLDFSAQGDKSGGFMQPNLKPAALSRLAGPIMGDVTKFIAGEMPKGAGFPIGINDMSDLPLPLLFGCIPLGSLINAVGDVVGNPERVPKFISEASTKIESFINGLIRLFEFVTDIPSQASNLGKAALNTFKATIKDLLEQAISYGVAQTKPVVDAMNVVLQRCDVIIEKLLVDDSTLPKLVNLASLPSSINSANSALDTLKQAANNTYNGVSLPAGYKQSILNLVQKLSTLLTQLGKLSALISANTNIWQALQSVVGTQQTLSDLLSDAPALKTRLTALSNGLAQYRSILAGVDLLDGALRSVVLNAVGTVESIIGDVANLSQFVQMLTGDELTVRFDWNPEISSWSLDGSTNYLFRANDKKGLLVAVEAKVKKNGSHSPKISVNCGLKHFDLVLIAPASFFELNFEKIEFTVDSASKMDVDVRLSDIKFVGPLSFVETLRDLIPLDGFSDPPYLDITAKGIDAGFSISLPSIVCGVLNIANISLEAGFTVPFIGQPLSVRFNFCRRNQPFLLTVYAFGGGGFFGITVDPHGVQILEASFEFGAAVSIDFGVASGGVYVMAGIYFRMEMNAASLTGYFRLGGKVSVLGLITASLELYLALTYEFSSGKCVGRAQLTIEVSVFLFSTSVTISCERKFAGSNGDPTIRQMFGYLPNLTLEKELSRIDKNTSYAWREYIEAFA